VLAARGIDGSLCLRDCQVMELPAAAGQAKSRCWCLKIGSIERVEHEAALVHFAPS
jgi:hypothetical protein